MTTLYKYLPPPRIDVLRNQSMRISQPCALNDPHDALIAVRSRLEEHDGGARVRADDFKVERIYARSLQEAFSGQIGVISLTAEPTNTLMWGHYAGSHAGFLLHFDQDSALFQQKLVWREQPYRALHTYEGLPYPSEVVYSDERKIYYIEDGVPWDVLFQKSLAWSYEREFRSLMNLSEGVLSAGISGNRWPVYLLPLPPGTITGVTFGVATDESLRQEIRELTMEQNIPLFQIRMQHLTYVLEQVPVD